jgi:uncharacterized membrane protein
MSIPRPFIIAFLIVAFLGFIDATYLTANHYLNAVPPCFIAQGCETVTTSVYSEILGIPVALLGMLHYLGLLILSIFYIDKKKIWALKLIFAGTIIGFLMSLWFFYVQLSVLQEFCTYCLFSGITSTTLFIIATTILFLHKGGRLTKQEISSI